MALLPGSRLGPYEIVAPLGAGGMGEVYRARDTRLDRTVALKVVPEEFFEDEDRKSRFEREARMLAALNHPNVAVVYAFEEISGSPGSPCRHLLSMELLEGETLRELLARGPLPAVRALEIGRQLAEGLAAAHAKGIVHRDLKPGNVVVTREGVVKLLDFGIAKLVQPEPAAAPNETTMDREPRTERGTVLGTPAYMAPEQARGLAVEARTDVFGFGLLLYELLTGRRPFDRGTWPDTLAAVMRDPAPPLGDAAVALPGEALAVLQRLLDRCLAKEMAARPGSMTGVARELETLRRAAERDGTAAGPARASSRSLVVLPFANLSSDPEQEFFSDGLTEEVIATLSKLHGLRVISRNSAMTLKGAKRTTQEIGQLLHVSHVLEGSVRKAGNNLRITAQLIDAASDAHLWAERFSGTLDDVFDIQEKVARAIAEALKVTLSPEEERRIGERPIADLRVLECWQRARHDLRLYTKEAWDRGIRTLQQGLDLAGDHPLLHAGIAHAHLHAMEVDLEPREAALRGALEAVEKARARDPRCVQGALAGLERQTGNLTRAVRHYENAVAESPEDVEGLFWLSLTYAGEAGKVAAAEAVAERLVAIDPLTISNRFVRGIALLVGGSWDRALTVYEDIQRREPGIRFLTLMRMVPLAWMGRVEEACRQADEIVAGNSEDMFAHAATALKNALLGRRGPVLEFVDGPLNSYIWNDPEFPWWIAGWLTLVHEHDRAYTWLERWLDRGAINYPVLASVDPFFEPLRGELRFQRLLDRVKPEWERFVPRFGPGSWDPVTPR